MMVATLLRGLAKLVPPLIVSAPARRMLCRAVPVAMKRQNQPDVIDDDAGSVKTTVAVAEAVEANSALLNPPEMENAESCERTRLKVPNMFGKVACTVAFTRRI